MRKSIFSVLLSLVMIVGLSTGLAFAAEPSVTSGTEEQISEDIISEEMSGASTLPEGTTSVPEEDTSDINLSEDLNMEAQTASGSVSLVQEKNTSKITATINGLDSLKKNGDQVVVTLTMYRNEAATSSVTSKKSLSKLDSNSPSWTFSAPGFGEYTAKIQLLKNNKIVKTLSNKKLTVVADEYNIMYMRATTPVLVTTLKLLGDPSLTTSASGGTIPTIVALSRPLQYNWNELPADWYANPMQVKADTNRNKKLSAMKDYLKELTRISPNSIFHFYLNDFHLGEAIRPFIYNNHLDASHYTLTMVTDGSGSYNAFKNTYGAEADAQKRHELLVNDYRAYREAAYNGKNYTPKYETFPNSSAWRLRSYVYAILDVEEENGVSAQWWVVRKSADTFELQDKTFQQKAISDTRITSNYLNGLLNTLQSGPNEEAFKKLYNFDDSKIKAAIKSGKKPMMILGSNKSVETSDPINPYVRFTMAYYGDDYHYLYKGHPGYITEDDPERVKEMTSLGMEILDSSIAAELFQYYNPNLYMSGFPTSTFQNAGGPENDCALYNIRKQAAASGQVYAKDMDLFISNMNKMNPEDSCDAAILNLAADLGIADKAENNDLYLVEFSDALINTNGFDIAIWDADASIIHYCKKEGDKYVREKTVDSLKSQKISFKKKTLKLKCGKTYDIAKYASTSGTGLLTVKSSKSKIVSVSGSKFKLKQAGKVKLTVIASKTGLHKAASKSITLISIPKTVKITKVTSPKKRTIRVKWNKDNNVSGYIIKVSTDKKFKKNVKTAKASKNATKKMLRKLKSHKTYYVKMCAYKTIDNKQYMGPWSKTLKKRVK